jgi:hypothetical protein
LVVFMRDLACASPIPGVFDDPMTKPSDGYVEEWKEAVSEPEEDCS